MFVLALLFSQDASTYSCNRPTGGKEGSGVCNCYGDDDCKKLANAGACIGAMTCSGNACSCPFRVAPASGQVKGGAVKQGTS